MTGIAFLVLLAGTLGWFVLPLLPALRELWAPTDTEPLRVVERDAGDVAFFARRFRSYLERQLASLPTGAALGDWYGRFGDGTPVLVVHTLQDALRRGPQPDGAHDRVVVIDPEVTLPGGETFLLEISARRTFHGGPGATYRAIDGRQDIHLGPASTVLRWVHADATLDAGADTALFGRASAAGEIRLGPGVVFERLSAPVIRAGQAAAVPVQQRAADGPPIDIPDGAVVTGDHTRIPGGLVIPEGASHQGHLVVRGALEVGAGARVRGSVKTHRGAALASGSRVDGAIVSRGVIVLGRHTQVSGPLIAEEEILIDEGSVIGSPETPTTVAAPRVRLGRGVIIHGQITAGEGRTESA